MAKRFIQRRSEIAREAIPCPRCKSPIVVQVTGELKTGGKLITGQKCGRCLATLS